MQIGVTARGGSGVFMAAVVALMPSGVGFRPTPNCANILAVS